MTIWVVIWVVLMILWLFGGVYFNYDAANRPAIGNTLLPWCCVLILGLILFGAVNTSPIAVQQYR